MKFSDFDFLELAFSTMSNIFDTVDSPNSLVVLKEGTKANHRITEFFSKVNLSTQKFYEVNTFNKNQDLDSLFIDFSKESLHDLDAYIDCSKNLLISALKTNVQQCKHKNSQKWLEQMSLIFGTYNRYFK